MEVKRIKRPIANIPLFCKSLEKVRNLRVEMGSGITFTFRKSKKMVIVKTPLKPQVEGK